VKLICNSEKDYSFVDDKWEWILLQITNTTQENCCVHIERTTDDEKRGKGDILIPASSKNFKSFLQMK
jgi:hypothetical protein